jgi:hypothetical protein
LGRIRVRAFCAGLLALLAIPVAVTAAPLPETAITAYPLACPDGREVPAAALPRRVPASQCDLSGRVIVDGEVRIAVPPPGQAVMGEAMLTSGDTELFEIRTARDGTVILRHVGDDSAHSASTHGASTSGGAGGRSTGACDDEEYSVTGYRDTGTHIWHYRASTTPRGLSVGAVAQDLVNGANAVTGSMNDCGLSDDVDAAQQYGGNTPHGTGIDHQGTCPAAGDKRYVTDFGNLPGAMLARTCWRGVTTDAGWWEITEADTKIRSAAALFTGAVPPSCGGNRFSIAAIAAHEAGHAFGMGHVDEAGHGDLTMSQVTPACSVAPYSLGLGDVRGLGLLY